MPIGLGFVLVSCPATHKPDPPPNPGRFKPSSGYRDAPMSEHHEQPRVAIRELADDEEHAVADLVMRSFLTHVGHEYSANGVEEFVRYADASALRGRLESGRCFTLVAVADDDVVGMIEFRDRDHLSMLFVDDRFHRRGIARTLVGRAIGRLGESGVVSEISVNSSRYAVPAYEHLGFEVSDRERTVNGITFIPMKLVSRSD